MSLADVKTKQENCLINIYDVLGNKGAIIPEQKNLVNVAPAIRSIVGGSGQYAWAKYSEYSKGENIPNYSKLLLNFNNNLQDRTGNNSIIANGTATYAQGKFNNALYFNGSTYLEMLYNKDLDTGDFTIACWVKLKNHTETQIVWSFFNNGAGMRLYLNNANNKFGIIIPYTNGTDNNYAGENGIYSFAENNENEWMHIALVRKRDVFTVYVNGISKGNYTSNITIKSDDKFLIGTWVLNNVGNNLITDGYIDDLIITKSALWTSNFTPPLLQYGDIGKFEEYVVSDDENEYPNNDYKEDGCFYKKLGNEVVK